MKTENICENVCTFENMYVGVYVFNRMFFLLLFLITQWMDFIWCFLTKFDFKEINNCKVTSVIDLTPTIRNDDRRTKAKIYQDIFQL